MFAVKKNLQEVREDDQMLQLVGPVRDLERGKGFYLEDQGTRIPCSINPERPVTVSEGQLVRVFGAYRVDPIAGNSVDVTLAQDVAGLDLELYRKAIALHRASDE
jgi:hypothetical protein